MLGAELPSSTVACQAFRRFRCFEKNASKSYGVMWWHEPARLARHDKILCAFDRGTDHSFSSGHRLQN